ncbi:SNF2 family N-terminal domain-containing protein [Halorientalis persicus]|uniref:SNF2 family N-terminal domain-containing protein n=1 Tax=Halorientalis persicus TaxID=1367881 RepID=A0A1H8V7K5_9EURY|nr:helicase-related protein [Halorientalis persicus]SEP11415.1 SNF2 family N-terminal domain-containing protein [Halorientalis persicus]
MPRDIKRLIDNRGQTLADIFEDVLPQSEEIRIATGYFYLSGFNLVKDSLDHLPVSTADQTAPFRILMGNETDQPTAEELEEGMSLREAYCQRLDEDLSKLNGPQLEQVDKLREYIERGLIDVRVRLTQEGYFHAKGASFHTQRNGDGSYPDSDDPLTVVGSSNFTRSGHTRNIELNLVSDDQADVSAFDEWYDSQWANAEPFSKDILDIIENNDTYCDWKTSQDTLSETFGTRIEPFELYKLIAYDFLDGNIDERLDSPLYHFQAVGYESARQKLGNYNGCIISDSVGLGKSFIGGELLRDYRLDNKRCLLVVPANLTDQWIDLLQDATDEDGNPYFNLEVDGKHLEVMSISKFQNLSYERVQQLRKQWDVVLIDEAHRFRNHGKWRPNPDDEDDYKGTRRHANLRELRGKTMIMLTATPINNSAKDLQNLISLFTDENEIRNKANLNFNAFEEYVDLSAERKDIVSGKEEATGARLDQINEQLTNLSEEISQILNEVMVLRSRKHVKDSILESDDIDISFKPPKVTREEYQLPPAYRPVYDNLPEVIDALHLPHITVQNPQAGSTLKALFKLNLLKRLESSTYAFVQSIRTVYESETNLLRALEELPQDQHIERLRAIQAGTNGDEDAPVTLAEFVGSEEEAHQIEEALEEFGFDSGAVRADESGEMDELEDATIGDLITYVQEDLTLLAYFLAMFISQVAEQPGELGDLSVTINQWLGQNGLSGIPDMPDDEINPRIYPGQSLDNVIEKTQDFYDAVFSLKRFRDPKIDELCEVIDSYDKKILVFTQYRATADYVYESLRRESSKVTASNSAVVKGGDENKQDIIKRFAPEASGYQSTLKETDEQELQYVVATDTLSEGVNLQDISVVVNYDLPWNPMRIVQRVGRVDRIGSTADKFVHNFFPDGDIEAAIKLLERLQAKINDIALIVGKENNILDPDENKALEEAGIETDKTIGEVEIDQIEDSLRRSRSMSDYNDLDDVSTNPLLRNAGSDERVALERLELRRQLVEEFGLETEDFEYAADYFDTPPGDRDELYTVYENDPEDIEPGLFGLAHQWFEDGSSPPLGRVQRALYHTTGDGNVENITKIRQLGIGPSTQTVDSTLDTEDIQDAKESIEAVLNDRLEAIRAGQVGGAFKQGEQISVEQEKILQYLEFRLMDVERTVTGPDGEPITVGEWANRLHERLDNVRLANTDEDAELRERFRVENKALPDWDTEVFLQELQEYLDEFIDDNPDYQSTLAGAGSADARLLCWGIINQ